MYGPDHRAIVPDDGADGICPRSAEQSFSRNLWGRFWDRHRSPAPVFYGAMGFIMGAISALLYNLFAKWVGGIELEMESRPQTLTAPYPIIPTGSVPNS
jgi:hypothetical protein